MKLNDDANAPPTLCVDVWRRLSAVILDEVGKLKKVDPLDKEITDHDDFGADRARFFIGRVGILTAISDYIKRTDPHPLAVHGVSGSGKTALMAQTVAQARQAHPEAEIMFRYIGATPGSSDGRTLLDSLCRQIARRYNADERDVPTDYKELIEEFAKRLALATAEKPLTIFLDALDQLSDADHARNLVWLPADLPEHVRLIVSTLPGECLSALEKKLPEANLVEVQPMPPAEGRKLLDLWLEHAGRTLQVQQQKAIIEKFTGCPLPLYLKLTFEEARLWRSYDGVPELGADIPGMIHNLFQRLSTEANHGAMLVSRSLGYLAAAKNGLTEDELVDVLSRDKEVFQDFMARAHHEPPERRLPVVVWSRLYFDLEPYLTERSADGTTLLAFYHRQLGEVVAETYLGGEPKRQRHRGLARYFGDLALWVEKYKAPNLRKVSEQPYQQTCGEMWKELEATLCCLEFIEAKCAAGLSGDLLLDCSLAAGSQRISAYLKSRVDEFGWFIRRNLEVLTHHPELTFQQAVNSPDRSLPAKTARERWKAGKERRPWIRHINKSEGERSSFLALGGHTQVVACCHLSRDNRVAVSGSTDGMAVIWDLRSGTAMHYLRKHESQVTCCAVCSGSDRVLIGSLDLTVKVWSIDSGEIMETIQTDQVPIWIREHPSNGDIVSVQWPVDPEDESSILQVWRPQDGDYFTLAKLRIDEQVFEAVFSTELDRVWYRTDRELFCWDLTINEQNQVLLPEIASSPLALNERGNGVLCLAFSPDEFVVLRLPSCEVFGEIDERESWEYALWSPKGGCAISSNLSRIAIIEPEGPPVMEIIEVGTGQSITKLTGHAREINDFAFSDDGSKILSCSSDRTVRLWNIPKSADNTRITKDEIADVKAEEICFSPVGLLAGGIRENELILLKYSSDRWEVLRKPISYVEHAFSLTFSPDSSCVSWVEPGYLNLAQCYDINADVVTSFEGPDSHIAEDDLMQCCFSSDGRRLLARSTHEILGWDVSSKKLVLKLHSKSKINDMIVSPDGKYLFTTHAQEHCVRICDIETGELVCDLECEHAPGRVRISPNGVFVAAPILSTDEVRVWEVSSGTLIAKLKTTDINSSFVPTDKVGFTACAFSPDSLRICTGGSCVAGIWNVHTGHVEHALLRSDARVLACEYFSDGWHLVLRRAHGEMAVFDSRSGDLIARWLGHAERVRDYSKIALTPLANVFGIAHIDQIVELLQLEGVDTGPPVVTPVRRWRFHSTKEQKEETGYREENMTARCPECGVCHPVTPQHLGKILTCPARGCRRQMLVSPNMCE
ncbi:MAG: AAA family ATPase [bacterium]